MNKIKIIYDVVRKMKDKNVFKGVLKAEGLKDQMRIFEVNNAFEKDAKAGRTKGKTNIEYDCDGKKMRLENNIDFEGEASCGHGPHGFMRHFHGHHHFHHNHEGHGGLKEGLGKITTVLGILSSIKIGEKDDNSVILSIESKDIPEDLKKTIQEKMKHKHDPEQYKHVPEFHKHMHDRKEHHMFMKEFHNLENAEFALQILINGESEVERITVDVNGVQKSENNECHDMKLAAELNFEW